MCDYEGISPPSSGPLPPHPRCRAARSSGLSAEAVRRETRHGKARTEIAFLQIQAANNGTEVSAEEVSDQICFKNRNKEIKKSGVNKLEIKWGRENYGGNFPVSSALERQHAVMRTPI